MGNITDDINRLCSEIREWRTGRANLYGDLNRFKGHISSEVSGLLRKFKETRLTTSMAGKTHRRRFMTDLRQGVASQKKSVVKWLAAVRNAHINSSKNAKADRQKSLFNLKSSVARMETGFRNSRLKMGKDMRKQGMQFLSRLKESVSEIKWDTAKMQASFREFFFSKTRKERTERQAFVNDLRQAVSKMKGEYHHDLMGAHETLSKLNGAEFRPGKKDFPRNTAIEADLRAKEEAERKRQEFDRKAKESDRMRIEAERKTREEAERAAKEKPAMGIFEAEFKSDDRDDDRKSKKKR